MEPASEPRFEVLIAEKVDLETIPTKPLCHYTSQRGLIGILNDRAMYATDAAYLNDLQEVVYAVNLAKKYSNDLGLDAETNNYLAQTENLVEKLPVYVASFSEEPDLLSQWRGYCPQGSGFTLCLSAERMIALAKSDGWKFTSASTMKPDNERS